MPVTTRIYPDIPAPLAKSGKRLHSYRSRKYSPVYRGGRIFPPRIIGPHIDPDTAKQLRVIPPTGTLECRTVVKAMGAALLPTTVMVLLHEANSVGDPDLVHILQQRLLGSGGVDGVYENGVINEMIEGWAKRFGCRESNAMADFRQEFHKRMITHIHAREGKF